MALTDTNYKFLYVDIGYQGRLSDGAVYRNCSFNKLLTTDQIKIPAGRQLSDLSDMNYFFLNQYGWQV